MVQILELSEEDFNSHKKNISMSNTNMLKINLKKKKIFCKEINSAKTRKKINKLNFLRWKNIITKIF